MSKIFVNGIDRGYKEQSNWWSNPNDIDSFRISSLDDDYPSEYFSEDHVGEKTVANYCNNIIRQYELFTGTRLRTIVEFGSGGGWFTNEFNKRGYNILGIEGSEAGARSSYHKNAYCIENHDIRCRIEYMGPKYDIALCTEVAGHIEPPFSSMLASNLIKYSDLIWWSSEEPWINKPHLHHPNEQPYKYWINLFSFYGYKPLLLPEEIYQSCEYRGRYIFYNSLRYEKP